MRLRRARDRDSSAAILMLRLLDAK